jgi:hypothetical protein
MGGRGAPSEEALNDPSNARSFPLGNFAIIVNSPLPLHVFGVTARFSSAAIADRGGLRAFPDALFFIPFDAFAKTLNLFGEACRLLGLCRVSEPADRASSWGRIMIPRLIRVLVASALAVVAQSASAVMAQDQGVRSGKIVTFAPAANVHELYVAVMGEVDTPGTYRLDSSGLRLHRIIQCARGFTPNASMAIKVIRPGRTSQTEIFSDKNDTPLMPGDLLIVESRQQRAGNHRYVASRDSQTIHAGYQEGTIRAGVQIALLNVLDYPVILRLRPEQANASYLVQALGQPISLLTNTRIITPDLPGRMTSEAAKRASRLDDGSVIVFERDAVNRDRLPVTLPKPFDIDDSEIESHAQFAEHSDHHSSDVRSLGQHPFWSNTNPFDVPPQTASDRFERIPEVLVSRTHSSAPVEDTQDSPIVTSVEANDGSDDQTQPIPTRLASLKDTDPIESEPFVSSMVQLAILLIVVGTILICAVLLGILRVQLSSHSPSPAPVQESSADPKREESRSFDIPTVSIGAKQLRDRDETISIPIRQPMVMGPVKSVTSETPSSVDRITKETPAPDHENASTPLAKALLQLEQRRSA